MDASGLLTLPQELAIIEMEYTQDTITPQFMSTCRSAWCPLCHQQATRIHSSYRRTVADQPCGEKRVRLQLLLQKFFCDNVACLRKIFVEWIASFIVPWARRTDRLNHSLQSIGLATCGKLGARLAQRLGMPASWMTIVRRILATPASALSGPPDQAALR